MICCQSLKIPFYQLLVKDSVYDTQSDIKKQYISINRITSSKYIHIEMDYEYVTDITIVYESFIDIISNLLCLLNQNYN